MLKRLAYETRTYRVVSVTDLLSSGATAPGGGPVVTREPCLPAMAVAIPKVSFGQVRRPAFPCDEFPAGTWDLGQYEVYDGFVYNIADAVVHGEVGVITVGDALIRESLYQVFPAAWGMTWIDDDHMEMPTAETEFAVDAAAHALCGAGGNRNYGHWWSNVVPALLVPPFAGTFANSTLLMPKVRTRYQRQTLDMIPEIRRGCVYLGEGISVACRELKFVPRITWSDYTPHPARLNLLAEMKKRAGVQPAERGRRIFVSRSDSHLRKLVNEADLAAIAGRYGFETVVLSGLSVAEQIRLFASATHIIGSHGAGLVNTVFCEPGTVLCELHKATTVNWSIRRAAAVPPLTYGCLVGHDVPATPDDATTVHDRAWTLPADAFEATLGAAPFR